MDGLWSALVCSGPMFTATNRIAAPVGCEEGVFCCPYVFRFCLLRPILLRFATERRGYGHRLSGGVGLVGTEANGTGQRDGFEKWPHFLCLVSLPNFHGTAFCSVVIQECVYGCEDPELSDVTLMRVLFVLGFWCTDKLGVVGRHIRLSTEVACTEQGNGCPETQETGDRSRGMKKWKSCRSLENAEFRLRKPPPPPPNSRQKLLLARPSSGFINTVYSATCERVPTMDNAEGSVVKGHSRTRSAAKGTGPVIGASHAWGEQTR